MSCIHITRALIVKNVLKFYLNSCLDQCFCRSMTCTTPGSHILTTMCDRFSGPSLFAMFATLMLSHEVLRNVLDGLPCVLGWCAFVPAHLILASSILLTLINQFTDRIFAWFGIVSAELQSTPLVVCAFS